MAEVKIRDAEQTLARARQEASYQDEWFELQPIEKKLITYSLALGIGLLIVFILIFKPF
ncbi:hypothetical protein [Desulforamulus hydrothermalis]|uniref:Uncharacterized protein n=1 Tax=Desulforamulus hydrothermalis Lam5 = DSM 18033 TaxID=1121428 RepID=K8EF43_9FIRM|nr:hypothetical protein [Desulforamulus hydrothermalis]CCO07331.1 conserved hypothetical protein [Desulforamulus hydrothermalis Lam5 = DSM 18033]SHG94226.1 hypothetical protein SAMN02745177_00878 [Desulforamulus hydrothermalis Lam5 = DSM 18033]